MKSLNLASRDWWIIILFVVAIVSILELGVSSFSQRYDALIEKQRAAKLSEDWMEVAEIDVSNALSGEDPWLIGLDRQIKFDGSMRMDWDVTIFHKIGTREYHLCSAEGFSANYSKNSYVLLPVPVLSWWMGVKNPDETCSIWPFPDGETCMRTRWRFTPEGYPEKTVHAPVACWQTITERRILH